MSLLNDKVNDKDPLASSLPQKQSNPSTELPLELNPNGTVRFFPPPIPSNILPHTQEAYYFYYDDHL